MDFDKSKVFTSLNADDVAVGSVGYMHDNLTDLEKIVKDDNSDQLVIITTIKDESFSDRFEGESTFVKYSSSLFYKIADDTSNVYVPYKGESDLIDDWYKRVKKYDDLYGYTNCMVMPAIWVREKSSGAKYQITGFFEGNKSHLGKPYVVISDVLITSYDQLLKLFTFLDESPCGKRK